VVVKYYWIMFIVNVKFMCN